MTFQQLLPIFALIAGLFYFIFPFINKKFFIRPKLTVEIEPNQGITRGRSPQGYASENDFSQPINRPEVLMYYELFWKFNLVIRNNSPYDAYNIELFNTSLPNGTLEFKSKINPNKPLEKHGEIVVPFEFKTTKKVQLKDLATLDKKEPDEFVNLEILLTYYNSNNRRFNTTFSMKTKEISYYRKRKNLNKLATTKL